MIKFTRIVIFCVIFCFLLFLVDLCIRYRSDRLENFYSESKNTLDVLFVGSSHANANINPAIIWQEIGVPSYVLGESEQAIYNSYYYIIESLKYQRPKLIVVEVYMAAINWPDYPPETRQIESTLGLRMSLNKINALVATVEKHKLPTFILGFPVYHTRYKEVLDTLFGTSFKKTSINGYKPSYEVELQAQPVFINDGSEKRINAKSMEYLLKFIQMAKDNDIELMFIVNPYAFADEHEKEYNFIKRIAEENDVFFINFNYLYDELKLNFETDFYDSGHLNFWGAEKLTIYLSQIISNRYGLKDKRNFIEYESWNEWAYTIREP